MFLKRAVTVDASTQLANHVNARPPATAVPLKQLSGVPGFTSLTVVPAIAFWTLGKASPFASFSARTSPIPAIWLILKYLHAFDAGAALRLSPRAQQVPLHHRTTMSEELGCAFGLQAARKVVADQNPGTRIDVVDADLVLDPASPFTVPGGAFPHPAATRRPDYFIIARKWYQGKKAGRVYVVENKGSATRTYVRNTQLPRAWEQVSSVVDAAGAPFSSVMTGLWAGDGDLELFVLDPPDDDWTILDPSDARLDAIEVEYDSGNKETLFRFRDNAQAIALIAGIADTMRQVRRGESPTFDAYLSPTDAVALADAFERKGIRPMPVDERAIFTVEGTRMSVASTTGIDVSESYPDEKSALVTGRSTAFDPLGIASLHEFDQSSHRPEFHAVLEDGSDLHIQQV